MELTLNKLEILLYLYENEEAECTVTKLAKYFHLSKPAISRSKDALTEAGYIVGDTNRSLRLTPRGRQEVGGYMEEVRLFEVWLRQFGGESDAYSVRKDALNMVTNISFDVKQKMLRRIRLNRIFDVELSAEHLSFSDLAKNLEDGEYPVKFLIHREVWEDNNYMSMADAAFSHPAVLRVKNAGGAILLKAVELKRRNILGRLIQTGKLMNMDYEGAKGFQPVQRLGGASDTYQLPADAVRFLRHENEDMVIGYVRLQLYAPMGERKMHKKSAVLFLFVPRF